MTTSPTPSHGARTGRRDATSPARADPTGGILDDPAALGLTVISGAYLALPSGCELLVAVLGAIGLLTWALCRSIAALVGGTPP